MLELAENDAWTYIMHGAWQICESQTAISGKSGALDALLTNSYLNRFISLHIQKKKKKNEEGKGKKAEYHKCKFSHLIYTRLEL